MDLCPVIEVQFQIPETGNPFGYVSQQSHVTGDNLVSLLGVTGAKLSGVHFLAAAGKVILAPVVRYADLTVANTTQTGTGALWKDVKDSKTKKQTLVQYSAVEDIAWTAESDSSIIDGDNRGFVVDLYLGDPPNDTADLSASGVYRTVEWPSASADTENRYRIKIGYNEQPSLEKSTDAGATWNTIQKTEIQPTKDNRLTLSTLVVDGALYVWLGTDFGEPVFIDYENGGYKAGKVKVSGKGGYTGIGFGNVRHLKEGYFVSYLHPGPADMHTNDGVVHPTGTKKADMTSLGQTMVGAIEDTDELLYLFSYRVTLTGTAMSSPDAAYTADTPFMEFVNIVWPLQYDAPDDTGWTDLTPFAYFEKVSFDPSSRILRRMCRLTTRIYAGELQPAAGVSSVQVRLGYQHDVDDSVPLYLRGTFVGNTEATYTAVGGDAFATYDCQDFIWFLQPHTLRRKLFPTRWCPYALFRLMLEYGGITPEWYLTLPKRDQSWVSGAWSPDPSSEDVCDYGPEPDGCVHTKFPGHPGFLEGTPILQVIDEVKEVLFAWYGQDQSGQIRIEPFEPEHLSDVIAKSFYPVPTGDGELYDEIGIPGQPALIRSRSVSGVKNSIVFEGVDQDTGAFIQGVYRDDDSLTDRTALNYTASLRPWIEANSKFVDQTFLDSALASAAVWARLPWETIVMTVNGQPDLDARETITVSEIRVLGEGSAVPYLITDMETTFSPPGSLVSVVRGLWTGVDNPPGITPEEP